MTNEALICDKFKKKSEDSYLQEKRISGYAEFQEKIEEAAKIVSDFKASKEEK